MTTITIDYSTRELIIDSPQIKYLTMPAELNGEGPPR
jgi:hypothetical protein